MATILIIDDDPLMRELVGRSMAALGHSVQLASCGRTGLECFRASPSDLVITDLVMPDMDGFDVINALRRERPAPIIIAMSGCTRFSGPALLHMAHQLGARHVLRKPFPPETLVHTVEHALKTAPCASLTPPD